MHGIRSFVAIGDSFTEGVGDELPDGRVRGWADLVALGLALAASGPVGYANLAIRGRLLAPIITEQLDAALALAPDLLSINGGGNDILRPRVSTESVADRIEAAVDRAAASGARVLLVSGADPTTHIPLGSLVHARGERLSEAIRGRLPKERVTYVDNWADAGLTDLRHWSPDRLHLGPTGHARVAASVLAALGVTPSERLDVGETQGPAGVAGGQWTAAYWRTHLLPWVGRRMTGRSSGDHRTPKSATLRPVDLG